MDASVETLLTVHKPLEGRDRHVAVFYLHGGGLVYGERDDLPAPYIRMLTEAGYTLICADYPLAPETALPGIVDAVFDTWQAAVATGVRRGDYTGYFLFGRSAGAYLSLMLAREIRRRDEGDALPRPLGVLDFYGYHDLTDAAFAKPVAAYTALPDVSRAQADRIAVAGGPTVTSGPKALRYALYMHARQHEGAWLDLMGLDGSETCRTAEAWSLSADDIALLPPLFVTASSGDEDVPMRMSKTLARTAPSAKPAWVYYLPHDFDRDTGDPAGAQAYAKATAWMEGLLP